jgi:predicted nucleic acid-binding protein
MVISGVFVVDASVLIDVCYGCIHREAITSFAEILTPDLVCAEVKNSEVGDMIKLGLVQQEYTGEELIELQVRAKCFPGLTHKDVAALLLAIDRNAILITGDDRLRTYANENGVEAHGVLWVLDKLVGIQQLDRLSAADALELMLANGSWLPTAECGRRIERWRRDL